MHRELDAKGLLDKPLDHDDEPSTPSASRRVAYVAMLEKHRDFLASNVGRGHATNQDLAQMTALWLANESLRLLSPSAAWPREKALEFAYAAVGLRPDPLGGFWVTRKGLALEPWGTLAGGYCGNYGLSAVRQICRLAELTGDGLIQQRALEAVRAAAHFVAPALDDEGRAAMRREEVISTRTNRWPGRVDFGGDEFTAAALKDLLSIRALQLAAEQGHPRTVLEASNAHFVGSVASPMRLLGDYAAVLALQPSDARLPMEPGQADYAWADEQAGVVVVKDRGARLYLSFNWGRGFRDAKRDPQHTQVNNIARIHYTMPTVDRIANVAMESPLASASSTAAATART